jgi:hypothetical protein
MNEIQDTYGKLEPDLNKCRTSMVEAVIPGTRRQMYYCRIDNADCRYARPFGFDYLCKHPENYAFPNPEDDADDTRL